MNEPSQGMNVTSLYHTVVGKLVSWAELLASMLPNLLVALLVVGLFWMLARFAQKLSDGALQRIDMHDAARGLLTTFIRILVLAGGVVIALGVMNLDKALASVLAGAGVVGLALGFAFQDLAGNIISGVGLAVNRTLPFKLGDIVETNDTMGVVKPVHLRTSIIETLDGKSVIIPNKEV